jgi:histidinol phosphatase-like enzyme (inositol monophosphatase family)
MQDSCELRDFVAHLAQQSGLVINQYFGTLTAAAIEKKSDNTPVTIADKKAEECIRACIRKEFPSHGILGEEFGHERPDAEYCWVIDPIDGTKAFIHQVPLFTTLIALLKNGLPILGCIHQPTTQQLCIGDSSGTTHNGRPVRVRECASIAEASLMATTIRDVEKYHSRAGFDRLCAQAKFFRTWGDGYGYLLVACGAADVMLDAIMNPWDILPVIPVIEGAGGTITNWQGASAVGSNSAVAAGPTIHSQVIECLK